MGAGSLMRKRSIDGVLALVTAYADPLNSFKNAVLYFFILPLRIGMVGAVTPQSWGFDLTPKVIGIYVLIVSLIAALAARGFGWRAALAVIVAGTFFYFGFSNFPWPAFIALVTVLAWRCAGPGVALFSLISCLFILAVGLWQPFMQTTYLCGLAVLLCLVIGGRSAYGPPMTIQFQRSCGRSTTLCKRCRNSSS